MVRDLLEVRYPHAERLVLVLDNLNTHKPVSYTHLDVYKRQNRGLLDVVQSLHHHRPAGSSRKSFFQGASAPCALQPVPTTPGRLFFHRVRTPFMPSHHLDLVAFYFPGQDQFGWAGDNLLAQWLGHLLHVVRIQSQLLRDLGIR